MHGLGESGEKQIPHYVRDDSIVGNLRNAQPGMAVPLRLIVNFD